MLGNQNVPVRVVRRSCSIVAAASVLNACAAAVHDGILFNCVLLTWSFCCTIDGLHSNACVTVGAFVIDGGDMQRSMFGFRQTDDLVEYIRCLDAVLCLASSTAVARACLGIRMCLFAWSRVPVPF